MVTYVEQSKELRICAEIQKGEKRSRHVRRCMPLVWVFIAAFSLSLSHPQGTLSLPLGITAEEE